MITPKFKLGTTLPTYNSGYGELFLIGQEKGHFPTEYLRRLNMQMPFCLLSITDQLRYEFEQRDKKITMKIRIPQTIEISSLHVLKIGDEYHKVFNSYHFTNKDGIPETDLTLEKYDLRGEIKNEED